MNDYRVTFLRLFSGAAIGAVIGTVFGTMLGTALGTALRGPPTSGQTDRIEVSRKGESTEIVLDARKGGDLNVILSGEREEIQMRILDGEAAFVISEVNGNRACWLDLAGLHIIDANKKAEEWP